MKKQRVIHILDKIILYVLFPGLLFAAWGYSHAAEYITASEIRVIAEQKAMVMASQPGVELKAEARVDDRIAMPACGTGPDSSVHSQTSSAMSVAVECRAPQAWTLYVPVRLEKTAEIVVLAASLGAGTVIDRSHLMIQTRDISQLAYGYTRHISDVIGLRLRRPLQAGWALAANDVEAPHIIRRGDRVTLVARSAGIEVRTVGQALSGAGVKEPIRVKNLSTKRLIDGWVTANGEVRVGF